MPTVWRDAVRGPRSHYLDLTGRRNDVRLRSGHGLEAALVTGPTRRINRRQQRPRPFVAVVSVHNQSERVTPDDFRTKERDAVDSVGKNVGVCERMSERGGVESPTARNQCNEPKGSHSGRARQAKRVVYPSSRENDSQVADGRYTVLQARELMLNGWYARLVVDNEGVRIYIHEVIPRSGFNPRTSISTYSRTSSAPHSGGKRGSQDAPSSTGPQALSAAHCVNRVRPFAHAASRRVRSPTPVDRGRFEPYVALMRDGDLCLMRAAPGRGRPSRVASSIGDEIFARTRRECDSPECEAGCAHTGDAAGKDGRSKRLRREDKPLERTRGTGTSAYEMSPGRVGSDSDATKTSQESEAREEQSPTS
ncbi:uncharacterized protein B0H18DRAFT_955883 [Fomitopsis serialis]|uniref:uncharacterized protein n=1 Tax=Fomitopsis serialis TaxID=139415 RepID=UPI0020082082|nr:uncharacterized protein B0H18DRAFT_955883 [Neoantrodia serialis]KAH9923327.1 hypothetical protein B0H18DRAFT_955883 [Neoantrodia serialis]